MSLLELFPCRLSNFEGPIDYLVHLVQQGEIALADVPVLALTEQFLLHEQFSLEVGAEFVGAAATLVWLKSKMLLLRKTDEKIEEPSLEIRVEILQQLVDYCSLKKASELLVLKEETQLGRHCRGTTPSRAPKERGLGLDAGLEDLLSLFQDALKRNKKEQTTVREEKWLVATAIGTMKSRLTEGVVIPLQMIFTSEICREEALVIFLAILELMKSGELIITPEGCYGVSNAS